MTLKDILEKTQGCTVIRIIFYRNNVCKQFISTADDILHNEKVWLDKEVHFIKIYVDTGEDGDDAFTQLCITLKAE